MAKYAKPLSFPIIFLLPGHSSLFSKSSLSMRVSLILSSVLIKGRAFWVVQMPLERNSFARGKKDSWSETQIKSRRTLLCRDFQEQHARENEAASGFAFVLCLCVCFLSSLRKMLSQSLCGGKMQIFLESLAADGFCVGVFERLLWTNTAKVVPDEPSSTLQITLQAPIDCLLFSFISHCLSEHIFDCVLNPSIRLIKNSKPIRASSSSLDTPFYYEN